MLEVGNGGMTDDEVNNVPMICEKIMRNLRLIDKSSIKHISPCGLH
jgi:hypothetical protein